MNGLISIRHHERVSYDQIPVAAIFHTFNKNGTAEMTHGLENGTEMSYSLKNYRNITGLTS